MTISERSLQDIWPGSGSASYDGHLIRTLSAIAGRWRYAVDEDSLGSLGDLSCIADDTSLHPDIVYDCINDLVHEDLAVALPGGLIAPTTLGIKRNDRL